MNKIIFLIVFAVSSFEVSAQDNIWNSDCSNIEHTLFKLDFDSAQLMLQNKELNKFSKSYLEGLKLTYEFFLNTRADKEKIVEELSDKIEHIEGLKDLRWRSYFISDLSFMKSAMQGRMGSYVSSGFSILKSKNEINKCLETDPNFERAILLKGVQQSLLSSMPSNYKKLASIFGLDGSYQDGLDRIEKIKRQTGDDFLRVKADFFSVFVRTEIGQEDINVGTSSKNISEYPILIYFHSYILSKNGNIDLALEFLKSSQDSWANKLNYLNYFYGKLLMFKLNPRAEIYLNRFIDNTASNDFKLSAIKYLAFLNLINDNFAAYENYKRIGFELFKDLHSESDIAAHNELMILKNKELLKAQMHFDGKEYAKSLKILKAVNYSSLKSKIDKILYHYLLGNIYQQTNQLNSAIVNLNSCINVGLDMQLHYQANALVHLSEIYSIKGDYKKAKQYAERCLELEDFPYSYSIHRKAKAIIRNLP